MAVLTGMVAGGMVFSSFTAPKQEVKSETSAVVLNDDGWEDWTVVTAIIYDKDRNGEWARRPYVPGQKNLKVQRRTWCGEPEYRIAYDGTWYHVSKSPTSDYSYCFYYEYSAFCFDM